MNLKIYKNKPVSWFDDWTSAMDHFWDSPRHEKNFLPACDFHETKDYYFFSFDVPGVKKENIHIEFNDNTLHISGEKKNEYRERSAEEGRQFHEKFYGRFQRAFTLPTRVKESAIETHFKDGVLELLIPKQSVSQGKTISVKDGGQKEGLFSRLLKNSDKEQLKARAS